MDFPDHPKFVLALVKTTPSHPSLDSGNFSTFPNPATMNSKQRLKLAIAGAVVAIALGKALLSSRPGTSSRSQNSSPAAATGLTCMTSQEQESFNREELFGGWQRKDGNCRNTRAIVLQTESVEPVSGGCSIEEGKWFDPYTGDTIVHPRDLDIDHIVPLKEAWRSGAWRWSKEERVAYANDPEVLLAVGKHANRSKGDKDPGEWMPPRESYQREYARLWATIKVKHHLSADVRERRKLSELGVKELPIEAPEGCAGI
jgi:hypothetical protein